MGRCVALEFNTIATRPYTIDRDCQLVAMGGWGGGLVSADPQVTYANTITVVSADQTTERIYCGISSFSSNLAFPSLGFSQGDVIYISPKAATSVILLYFEP